MLGGNSFPDYFDTVIQLANYKVANLQPAPSGSALLIRNLQVMDRLFPECCDRKGTDAPPTPEPAFDVEVVRTCPGIHDLPATPNPAVQPNADYGRHEETPRKRDYHTPPNGRRVSGE